MQDLIDLAGYGFAGYLMDQDGVIYSVRYKDGPVEPKPVKYNISEFGWTVQLFSSETGRYSRYNVSTLVATVFVERFDEVDDTVLHIDNDRNNYNPRNLRWRPGWLVREYRKGIDHALSLDQKIMEVETGSVFRNIGEAAQYYGMSPKSIADNILDYEHELRGEGTVLRPYPTRTNFVRFKE